MIAIVLATLLFFTEALLLFTTAPLLFTAMIFRIPVKMGTMLLFPALN